MSDTDPPVNRRTEPISKLLKANGVELSAVAANKKLLAAGVLEEKQRPSGADPGKMKKYKAFTANGLRFGINLANDRAQGETAPQYYQERFAELVKKYLAD